MQDKVKILMEDKRIPQHENPVFQFKVTETHD